MPLLSIPRANAYQVMPPPDGLFLPDYIADLLGHWHAYGETFALETVNGSNGYRLFVRFPRGDSKVRTYLEFKLGYARRSNDLDWLRLLKTEYAVVRTATLSGHAVLSISREGPDAIDERWQKVLRHIVRLEDDAFDGTLGVRLLLGPAATDWQEGFKRNVRAASRDGRESPDSWWSAKANGPAFRAELQMVAICKDDREKKRLSKAAVARLTELMVELAGGADTWKRRTLKEASGARLGREHRNQLLSSFEPWPPLNFMSPERHLRYVLSPAELAPLWPAPLAYPTPVTIDVVLSDQSEVETVEESPGIDLSQNPDDVFKTRWAAAIAERDVPVKSDEPAVPQSVPPSGLEDTPVEDRKLFHSTRPPNLPVRGMPDRKALREGRQRGRPKESARHWDDSTHDRRRPMQKLGLTRIDVELFDRLGDLPLASRQDLADAAGRGLTTVHESMDRLSRLGLVKSRRVYVDGKQEHRFWIPDDRWDEVIPDRSLPHTDNMLTRLWLNPEALAAVYRLAGVLVLSRPGRELVALRWLWRRPFDAVAQCDDGWAAFLWVGIWQDTQRLDRRLQECWSELGRWSGNGPRRWPGRIFIVTPNAWVSELVWRAVSRQGWQESCTTLNLEDDELIGKLDLEHARGAIPLALREEPPRLRADVDRLIDLLENDPASRMRRLLQVMEMHPGVITSHLERLTGINGRNTKEGLAHLETRQLIDQPRSGRHTVADWVLAMAARRDGVWGGLPGRRHGAERIREYTERRWRRLRDVQRLLAKFSAVGCPVAPGWMARDGNCAPDGVVWLDESPFGRGWHYIVSALHAKSQSTIKTVMDRALADARTDQFPILVVCRDEMEELVWELGAGRAVLTASATRVRSLPVVGQDGNAWLHSGKAAPMLSNRQRNAREEVN